MLERSRGVRLEAAPVRQGRGYVGVITVVGERRTFRTMATYETEGEAVAVAEAFVAGALEALLAAQEWREARRDHVGARHLGGLLELGLEVVTRPADGARTVLEE